LLFAPCRFISWVFQSAKYSAQCNIIAFIYIKRIISRRYILSIKNWRAIWIGAVIISQKFVDDISVRTSSFCEILPGVTKQQLKAIELRVFELLDYTGRVKPAVYAKFYYELRAIFESITGQLVARRTAAGASPLRPLTRAQGSQLLEEPDVPQRGRSRQSTAAPTLPPVWTAAPRAAAGPETDTARSGQAASAQLTATASMPALAALTGAEKGAPQRREGPTVLPPISSTQQQRHKKSGKHSRSKPSKGRNKSRSLTAEDVNLAYTRALLIVN
jgi:hypothetical protein